MVFFYSSLSRNAHSRPCRDNSQEVKLTHATTVGPRMCLFFSIFQITGDEHTHSCHAVLRPVLPCEGSGNLEFPEDFCGSFYRARVRVKTIPKAEDLPTQGGLWGTVFQAQQVMGEFLTHGKTGATTPWWLESQQSECYGGGRWGCWDRGAVLCPH